MTQEELNALDEAQQTAIKQHIADIKAHDEAERQQQHDLFESMKENPFTRPTRYY